MRQHKSLNKAVMIAFLVPIVIFALNIFLVIVSPYVRMDTWLLSLMAIVCVFLIIRFELPLLGIWGLVKLYRTLGMMGRSSHLCAVKKLACVAGIILLICFLILQVGNIITA